MGRPKPGPSQKPPAPHSVGPTRLSVGCGPQTLPWAGLGGPSEQGVRPDAAETPGQLPGALSSAPFRNSFGLFTTQPPRGASLSLAPASFSWSLIKDGHSSIILSSGGRRWPGVEARCGGGQCLCWQLWGPGEAAATTPRRRATLRGPRPSCSSPACQSGLQVCAPHGLPRRPPAAPQSATARTRACEGVSRAPGPGPGEVRCGGWARPRGCEGRHWCSARSRPGD